LKSGPIKAVGQPVHSLARRPLVPPRGHAKNLGPAKGPVDSSGSGLEEPPASHGLHNVGRADFPRRPNQ
jgi:hypothetical protein